MGLWMFALDKVPGRYSLFIFLLAFIITISVTALLDYTVVVSRTPRLDHSKHCLFPTCKFSYPIPSNFIDKHCLRFIRGGEFRHIPQVDFIVSKVPADKLVDYLMAINPGFDCSRMKAGYICLEAEFEYENCLTAGRFISSESQTEQKVE
ncbi:hypothetical protein BJ508DRAFT_377938 [Ascobolus immersus RN42]|uniref:Uncharacterized protein n=1 Tax=Ascobolus immersus RN42 TaxID=1160509 RepID=A0A3N4HYQ7_ASCIM|nr:hypothetical protein BJ508DRAFT_377938 [Ascobolus immersus RN42]